MGAPENILLIRFKSIGDILFTLPSVHRLREHFLRAKITYLVSRENAPLIEGFREVQAVLAVDRMRLRGRNPVAALREMSSLLRQLRRGHFSIVVDFQGYGETAALSWWTKAPQRWGAIYNKSGRPGYTHAVRHVKTLHPAYAHLNLLEQCGVPSGEFRNEFVLPINAADAAREFSTANGFDMNAPALFVQPFTSSPHKNWPLERYLATAMHWRERGFQVVFSGGPKDLAAMESARRAGFIDAAGQPLLTAAGLMKQCSLTLGGDTGLLHLAVAMGKRVVMIMNSAAPGKPVPLQHADWAVTPPAGAQVPGIETGAVIQACERALAEIAAPGRR